MQQVATSVFNVELLVSLYTEQKDRIVNTSAIFQTHQEQISILSHISHNLSSL